MEYQKHKRKHKPRVYISIGLLICVLSYTAFETSRLIKGPQIQLLAPINGQTIDGEIVKVKGTAANITSLALNGAQLFTDTAGYFEKDILLSPGYNVIEVNAVDKFGRKIHKTLELVSMTNTQGAAPVASVGGGKSF